MDSLKLGAGVLAMTVGSVALGISPHAVCNGQSETIGCKHDDDIHEHEPAGPLSTVPTMSANGGSTSLPPGKQLTAYPIFDQRHPAYGYGIVFGQSIALLSAATETRST